MRILWISLVVLMMFTVSCGDFLDTKDDKNSETEAYGEETIGYRNSSEDEVAANDETGTQKGGDPTGDAEEDAGYTGDTGDTGNTGNSGETEVADSSSSIDENNTDNDDDSELPDDDPFYSDSVQKDSSWTDWAGLYFKGNLYYEDLSLDYAQPGYIDSELNGDDFLSGTFAGVLRTFDGKVLADFADPYDTFFQGEYKFFSMFTTKEKFDELLLSGQQDTGLPVFLMTRTMKMDILRKECVLAFTDKDTDYIGNAQASMVYSNDIFFNVNVKLTTDEETVIAAANELMGEEHAEFTEPCICYDTDGTIMDCGALDEELGNNIVLLNEDAQIFENPFYTTSDNPAITFGLDVDTASYTLVRSKIKQGLLPDPESVRIEEMINYFKYYYKKPEQDKPFTLYSELGKCPWNPKRKLLMIGVRGQEIEMIDQPAANIVYLIDVSGSMYEELPLMKKAFRLLAEQMRPDDTVSIITYAGADKIVLDGAKGSEKQKILDSLDALSSGGSTAGAAGITTAYEIAEKHFIEGGNNRVVLATDGDFNVGISSDDALVGLIGEKKETGVFFSVYGFGGANYQDVKMEQLADNGNGVYFYIDSEPEARRAFMHSLSGSMLTIAKDVKLQLQFNSKKVKGFRLIGYDNRVMSNDDFNDDTVDGGELGNGQDMTAFVEIIPIDSDEDVPPTPEGQNINEESETEFTELDDDVYVAVRIRYKDPDEDTSELIENNLTSNDIRTVPSIKFLFASAVAEFGLILRHSVYIEERSISEIAEKVKAALAADPEGAIQEFIDMVIEAHDLGN